MILLEMSEQFDFIDEGAPNDDRALNHSILGLSLEARGKLDSSDSITQSMVTNHYSRFLIT